MDRSSEGQNYVAVFKPALIARSCRTPLYEGLKIDRTDRDGVLHTILDPASFDLIRKTMDSLMQGSLDPDLLNREAGFGFESKFSFQHGDPDGLNAGLHHLLLLGWRSRQTGKVLGEPVALHPSVRKALKLLSEGGCEENSTSLARACGVSPAYLSRVFARQIGVPLSRYRNTLRLALFWEAYRQPEQKTLSEAVFAAGFGSYAQFYKVFAQAYGHGPRASLTRVEPAVT